MNMWKTTYPLICLCVLVCAAKFSSSTDAPLNCLDRKIDVAYAYGIADVVLCGTVVHLDKVNPLLPRLRPSAALVRVKRAWKDKEDVLKNLPTKDVIVAGLNNVQICPPSRLLLMDTKIFFLIYKSRTLLLNSTIVSVNLKTIHSLNLLATGANEIAAGKVNEIAKIGCERMRCKFRSVCESDNSGDELVCKCPRLLCEDEMAPVCGMDNKTYSNECQLFDTECRRQKYIGIRLRRACEDEDPCDRLRCTHGAVCVRTSDGKGATCACNVTCKNLIPTVPMQHVCADDGVDYESICHMERHSCVMQKSVRVKQFGKCDPCHNVDCPDFTICKVGPERSTKCRCSDRCPVDFEPVCASDGHTYPNVCFMHVQSCRGNKELVVLFNGTCESGASPCERLNCSKEEICEAKGPDVSCTCNFHCQPIFRPVCATDGLTYDNECELERSACVDKRRISLLYQGQCSQSECSKVQCPYGAVCQLQDGSAVCTCPTCNHVHKPICASNRRTYDNECKMKRDACLRQQHLFVLYQGVCMGCENLFCDFNAQCVSNMYGGGAECQCPKTADCADEHSQPVCGTDGVTYSSICAMKKAACEKRAFVVVASKSSCDSRGHSIGMTCPRKCHYPEHKEVICASDGKLYPSLCHMHQSACKKNTTLSPVSFTFCTTDSSLKHSMKCKCNPNGSVSKSCDAKGRCKCKPHVVGDRCDHCESNFWGIHLTKNLLHGCAPCNCSPHGSAREDCEQMTGRCVCKTGVKGFKCDTCESDNHQLVKEGCIPLQRQRRLTYGFFKRKPTLIN